MSPLQKRIIKFKQSFRLIPALRLVWQAAPGWTVAQIILLLFQSILPLALLYLSKLIIDAVTESLTTDKAIAWQKVLFLLLLTGVITIINTLWNSLLEVVNTAQSQRVSDHMQHLIHAKSIEVDLEFYDNPEYFDTHQRAQSEGTYRPNQILSNLLQVAQEGISLVAMVGLLLSLHWGVAGIIFVAAIPSVLVRVKYADIMYHWQRHKTAMERQAAYFYCLLTGDTFAKEIRLFNLGNLFSDRFSGLRAQIYKQTLAITTKRAIAGFASQSLAAILMLAAYGFIVYQSIQGILKIGDLFLYYQAFQRGQQALKGVLGGFSALYEDNLFLANLFEFLELKPKISQPTHPKPVPQAMQTGIEFHNVSFQYSSTTRKALTDINLTIKPGEVIALVGENGSGKTTLIKLLCRLYDPTSGNITIDEIDIHNFDITELRRQFSVIFQDYVKYHFTAQENIWLGNVDISPTDDKVTFAAHLSGADAVIKTLPQGYDTMLGKWFDQGEELSIGQWQKVALARAFLRDSQVIVLDEPTSAMDPKAEAEVFEGFRQLIQGQAAILISHRLSTVKMADRIYVMEKGTIVESGNHEELIQKGGNYAYLFETQAKNYR
jgi:ATP-binding cassette, subfamily B, bacterial